MSLFGLTNVTLSLGGPLLLDGVDLQIEENQRIGLVGRNGAGKSTLLRLIESLIAPDDGQVTRRKELRVASLPQVVPRDMSGTATSWLERAAKEAGADDWEGEKRVSRILSTLLIDPEAEVGSMSAGMKRRVLLGCALVSEPDLLLLDEPTNHLDLEAIDRLETVLKGWRGTFLLVTHDRAFLRAVTTRTLDLDRGKLTSYDCNYGTYIARREAELEIEEQRQAEFDKKLAKEEAWIRRGVKARRKRNQGRVRRLEEMREARRERRASVGTVKAGVREAERSGRLVLKADGISHDFGGAPVIDDFSMVVSRGDRIGIIGPNGCGKSTLLRILLGDLEPKAGSVREGTGLEVAVFDQLQLSLDEEASVQDNVADGADRIELGGESRHVLGYLRDFLFTPEQIRSSVSRLSGGERNRLLLARILAKPCNVLVLDEPTNDLDMETLEVLENLLADFAGTVLVVSHDREFLDNVVTSTLVFEGDGHVKEFDGGYSDWQRVVRAREKEAAKARAPKEKPQREKPAAKRRLSFKEKRELEALPDRIEALETEKGALEERMASPDFYRDAGAEVAEATARLEALTAELDEVMERWAELESIAEGE